MTAMQMITLAYSPWLQSKTLYVFLKGFLIYGEPFHGVENLLWNLLRIVCISLIFSINALVEQYESI